MKRKLIIIFIWLLIWQGVSLLVHNPVLFVGPWETVKALGEMVSRSGFYSSLFRTLIRLLIGILAGTGLGFLFAYCAYRKRFLRDFLAPVVSLGKAVPVGSFVILILIWFGNEWVAMVVVFLVTFPIAYLNLQKGLDGLDLSMAEVATVFRFTGPRRFRYVELPQLRSHIGAAIALTIGMGFKSGIAAEVIGQARFTIGNELYQSKIYLETAELFAWTAMVILLSWGVEKLITLVLKRLKIV